MSLETTKRIRSACRATSRARASRTSPPTSSMPGVSIRTSRAPVRPGVSAVACSHRCDDLETVVPWVVPTLKTSWPSSALSTDDLPRLTMPKAAISIVLSSSLRLRSRSWRSSSASARSSSGVSLRLFSVSARLSRARSTTSSRSCSSSCSSIAASSGSMFGSTVVMSVSGSSDDRRGGSRPHTSGPSPTGPTPRGRSRARPSARPAAGPRVRGRSGRRRRATRDSSRGS